MNDFASFKARIKPYLVNVLDIAVKQLRLFQVIGERDDFSLSDHALADYMYFVRSHKHRPNAVPSLEVQLLWMVHALNPRHYHADLNRVLGTQLAVVFPDDLAAAFGEDSKGTRREHQPDTEHGGTAGTIAQHLDLRAAVRRQMSFVDKINIIQRSGAICATQLKRSEERYIKFLYLMVTNRAKTTPSVPTLDIDLLWHSHQLDAVRYQQMSRVLFPKATAIHHDDAIADTKLRWSARCTAHQWNTRFGHDDYLEGRAFKLPSLLPDAKSVLAPRFADGQVAGGDG